MLADRVDTRWLALADEQLETVERVQRPVGLFVAPAIRAEGWQLSPVLSLDAIRLVEMLGGHVDRDLCGAALTVRPGAGAARANQRADAARRAQGVPGLRRAARVRSSRRSWAGV